MVVPLELLEGCHVGCRHAWHCLEGLIEEAVVLPLCRLVRRTGCPPHWAEDLLQEFRAWLVRRNVQPLMGFQGSTLREFRAYLRRVALRFADRRIDRWRLRLLREGAAVLVRAASFHQPAADTMLLEILDWAAALPEPERRRAWTVLHTMGIPAPEQPLEVDPRTIRRWRRDLDTAWRRHCVSE